MKRKVHKMNKYSYSRLSMFEGCERQFFHKYIEGRPYPSNAPMKLGKIFHRAIESVIVEGYSPEEAAYYAAYEEGGLPENEKMSILLAMLYKAYRRIPDDEYLNVSSETHMEAELENGAILQGFVDVVIDDPSSDTIEIWDFKTSWRSTIAEDSKQLALYGWLFKTMRGGIVAENFRGRLVFPRLKQEEGDSVVEFQDTHIEEATTWAVDLIEKIESKDLLNMSDWNQAKDKSKCEYCPFATLCSSGFIASLPSDGVPATVDEAERIGAFILSQEQTIKKMKEGLKQYAKEHDGVMIGTGKFDFIESDPNPKIEDVQSLIDFAVKHELDINTVLKPDSNTLKDWVKGDTTGELKSKISWTKPRKTFRFVK